MRDRFTIDRGLLIPIHKTAVTYCVINNSMTMNRRNSSHVILRSSIIPSRGAKVDLLASVNVPVLRMSAHHWSAISYCLSNTAQPQGSRLHSTTRVVLVAALCVVRYEMLLPMEWHHTCTADSA